MVHIARCTPPSVALEGLHLFDEEVRQTFSDSMCIDPSDSVIITHVIAQMTISSIVIIFNKALLIPSPFFST